MPSEWLGVHGGRSYGPSPRGKSIPGPAVLGTKKNSVMKVVNMRSAGGESSGPPSPPPPVQVPPLRPNLDPYGFGQLSQS